MRMIGKPPSRLTPELCLQCEAFARNIPGGAEIELTMLFADVRGSTALAEQMSPYEFSQLVNRFYVTGTEILVRTHGWVDRLVGDQIVGLYIPGFAGQGHARLAIDAALSLLVEMGHRGEEGPILPVGAGVHTDVAFVGAVGTEGGATDITVLGDAANTAARLSSQAKTGQVLVSESCASAAGLDTGRFERREVALKGKSEAVSVYTLNIEEDGEVAGG
jgi:adenylate cyclase